MLKEEVIDRQYLNKFFFISSLKCSNCGELGLLIGEDFHCTNEAEIPKDNKKQIVRPQDYDIYNTQEWETEMNIMFTKIVQNKKKVLHILPLLEERLPLSCDRLRIAIEKNNFVSSL